MLKRIIVQRIYLLRSPPPLGSSSVRAQENHTNPSVLRVVSEVTELGSRVSDFDLLTDELRMADGSVTKEPIPGIGFVSKEATVAGIGVTEPLFASVVR